MVVTGVITSSAGTGVRSEVAGGRVMGGSFSELFIFSDSVYKWDLAHCPTLSESGAVAIWVTSTKELLFSQ
jgi:hypothetical protein